MARANMITNPIPVRHERGETVRTDGSIELFRPGDIIAPEDGSNYVITELTYCHHRLGSRFT